MIWVKQDFYTNFAYANATGDADSVLDMYQSELSDLIVHNTDDLYNLLKKLGMSSNKNETDEALLNRIYQASKTNSKLVRSIAYLIGQTNNVNAPENAASQAKMLDKIADGITSAQKELAVSKNAENMFLKKTLDQIATKAAAVGDRKRVVYEKKNYFVQFVGVAILGIVLYAGVKWFKSLPDKAAPKLEMGGIPPIGTPASAPPAPNAQIDPKYYVAPTVLDPKLNPTMTPQPAATQAPVSTVAPVSASPVPSATTIEAPKV